MTRGGLKPPSELVEAPREDCEMRRGKPDDFLRAVDDVTEAEADGVGEGERTPSDSP